MSAREPCPWCGGKPELEEVLAIWVCTECLAEGPPEDEDGTLWNTRAPDWQDISTAPRDGTDVLIGLGDTIAIGFYCPENDPRLPPGWIWAGEDLWFRCEPTHWMPLPAPPKEVG
jgi:hypothetical protein